MTNGELHERATSPEERLQGIHDKISEAVYGLAERHYEDKVEASGEKALNGTSFTVYDYQPVIIVDRVPASALVDDAPTAAEYLGIKANIDSMQFIDVTYSPECFVGDNEENTYYPSKTFLTFADGSDAQFTRYVEFEITGKSAEDGSLAEGVVRGDKEWSPKVSGYDPRGKEKIKEVSDQNIATRGLWAQFDGSDQSYTPLEEARMKLQIDLDPAERQWPMQEDHIKVLEEIAAHYGAALNEEVARLSTLRALDAQLETEN